MAARQRPRDREDNDDAPEKVGRLIRHYLEQNKIPIANLAAELKVNRSMISHVMAGRDVIQIGRGEVWADALNIIAKADRRDLIRLVQMCHLHGEAVMEVRRLRILVATLKQENKVLRLRLAKLGERDA